MKTMILGILLLASASLSAQDSNKTKVLTYKTYPSFPAFPLLSIDSTRFNTLSVQAKKGPTIVMYFSPTCSHCQHQAEEITGHIKELRHVKFLMVSSYPLAEIRQFAETYAINRFENIKLAYDPESKLVGFYELKSLPGIFVYDKNGKFKKSFPTNVKAQDLIEAVKE